MWEGKGCGTTSKDVDHTYYLFLYSILVLNRLKLLAIFVKILECVTCRGLYWLYRWCVTSHVTLMWLHPFPTNHQSPPDMEMDTRCRNELWHTGSILCIKKLRFSNHSLLVLHLSFVVCVFIWELAVYQLAIMWLATIVQYIQYCWVISQCMILLIKDFYFTNLII